jgi:hypothetical protein
MRCQAIAIRIEPALVAVACLLGIGGCNLPTACDCGPTGTTVIVPQACAADVAGVAITGPCTLDWDEEADSDAQAIHVEATANGTCHLEVTFHDAPSYAEDLEFRLIDGDCCHGYYAVGARSKTLPVPDAGCDESGVETDAGAGRAISH